MTVEQPESQGTSGPAAEASSERPEVAAGVPSESASLRPAEAVSDSAWAARPEQPARPEPQQPAGSLPGGAPHRPVAAANVHPIDWGIMAAGLLTLIFSFLDYYDYSLGPFSVNYNAWDGFFGWFSTLVALLSAVLLAASVFMPGRTFPVPPRVTVLAGFALSTLCVLFAGFIDSRTAPAMVDTSRGAGYWLSLIAILSGLVLSFLRVHEDGSTLPWEHRKV